MTDIVTVDTLSDSVIVDVNEAAPWLVDIIMTADPTVAVDVVINPDPMVIDVFAGPKGDKGDKGDTGAPGPEGPPGTAGIGTWTGGSVAFATSSSSLGEDNANLFYDDSNNKLGVGTRTPFSRLTITGASHANDGGGGTGIVQVSTGTGAVTDEKLQIGVLDGAHAWLQASKPGTAPRSLSLNPGGGNVGIGTVTPGSRLQVVTPTQYDGITVNNGTNTTVAIGGQSSGNDNGYLQLANSAAVQVFLQAAGASYLLGGNVGIGTAGPLQKLAITGASGAAGGGGTSGILAITTGTGVAADNKIEIGIVDASYAWINASKPGTSNLPLSLNPGGGNVGIGVNVPNGKLHVASSDFPAIVIVAGTSKAVRFGATSASAFVEGVDNTGIATQQPLTVGGSTVTIQNNGANAIVVSAGLATLSADPTAPLGVATKQYVDAKGPGAGAWTVGSLAFATSTNALGQDNVNLFWDDTNNKLGVGNKTPFARLTVTGTSNAYAGGGADGPFQITTGTAAVTDEKLEIGVVDGAYSWLQASKPGTAPRNLILNPGGGNVGIGTTTTTSGKLQIAGAGYTQIAIFDSTNTTNAEYVGYAAGNAFVGVTGNENLRLQTNGQDRVILTGAGGINLYGVLTVVNTITASDPTTGAGSGSSFNLATGTANSTVRLYLNDNAGAPYAGILTGSAIVQFYRDANTHLWRSQGGATQFAQLNSIGLGVGNISPAYRLHVAGADSGAIGFITGVTKGVRIGATSIAAAVEGVDNTGAASFQPLVVGGSTVILQNNGAEVARVTGGNVGIGTTGPTSKLEVYGDAGLGIYPATNPTTVATARQLKIGEQSKVAGYDLALGYGPIAGAWSGSLQVNVNNVPSPLLLNPSGGTVGIGTTTPGTVLDVRVGTNQKVAHYSTAGLTSIGALNDANSAWLPFNISPDASVSVCANSGNVGIGTTNPRQKLEIAAASFPGFAITDNSAGTDLKTFDFLVSAGTLYGRMLSDGFSAGNYWVTVARTGYQANQISFSTGASVECFRLTGGGIIAYTSVWPGTTNALLCGTSANAWSAVWAYAHSTASDPSLKTDIQAAPDGALDRVMDIEPKTFRWKDKPEGPRHRGFLSTDVRRVMGPDFAGVIHDDETGLEGIEGLEMTAVLWKAVQELTAKMAMLEARMMQ